MRGKVSQTKSSDVLESINQCATFFPVLISCSIGQPERMRRDSALSYVKGVPCSQQTGARLNRYRVVVVHRECWAGAAPFLIRDNERRQIDAAPNLYLYEIHIAWA
jgi:hypothetical protein